MKKVSPRLIATSLWVLSAVAATQLLSDIFGLSPRHYFFLLALLVGLVLLVDLNLAPSKKKHRPKQISAGSVPKQLPATAVREGAEASSPQRDLQPEPLEPREWLNDFLRKQQSD